VHRWPVWWGIGQWELFPSQPSACPCALPAFAPCSLWPLPQTHLPMPLPSLRPSPRLVTPVRCSPSAFDRAHHVPQAVPGCMRSVDSRLGVRSDGQAWNFTVPVSPPGCHSLMLVLLVAVLPVDASPDLMPKSNTGLTPCGGAGHYGMCSTAASHSGTHPRGVCVREPRRYTAPRRC
jgi:hypothetical protein